MGTSVVACCDTPPVLETAEHVFDLVALAAQFLVVGDFDLAAALALLLFKDGRGLIERPPEDRLQFFLTLDPADRFGPDRSSASSMPRASCD